MTCKDCGYHSAFNEVSCPHCGSRLPTSTGLQERAKQVTSVVVFVGVIIIFMAVGFFMRTPASKRVPVSEVAHRPPVPSVEHRKAEILRQVEIAEGVGMQQEQEPPPVATIAVPERTVHTDEGFVAELEKILQEDAIELADTPVTHKQEQLSSPSEDDAREREREALAAFRKRLAPDVQRLDFYAAREKVKTEQQVSNTSGGVAGQAALAGVLAEAEMFHLWLSKEVAGFRFSRGGRVERSDRQNIHFSGTSMPWSAFYVLKAEHVGDMINNLVLDAMATKDMAIEEKGLLLIQTSAFLSLFYPEKVHARDKTEEILALVLENCTNHVSKVQSLFPDFCELYTNGMYLAKVQSKELQGLEDVEKPTGRSLNGEGLSSKRAPRTTRQQLEAPTEAAAIRRATELVIRTLPAYPLAREARYVTSRTVFHSFQGESLKRFTPRLTLVFNFRYRTPAGHERWNLGPVNLAYDTEGKCWVMMGFCEATITGQNYLDTQEGQQAVQVAVRKAVPTASNLSEKNDTLSTPPWQKSDLRSYDSRHPRNTR